MVHDVRDSAAPVQVPSAVPAQRRRGARSAGADLRPDVQGLRVVAVLLVVLFHLWPNRVRGGYVGVDVFFVISGFLITSHLVRTPPTSPRLLAEFWGRRVRRLLPAALLVLLVTLVASRLVAPDVAWATTASDVMAATVYVANWALASRAVDYLGAESAATPVQHFWSLSAEEQFYVVWPVLIGLLVGARRMRRGARGRVRHWAGGDLSLVSGRVSERRVIAAGLAVLVAGSLTYSVWLTAMDPARAYFVTPTRAWEFGIGALAALADPTSARRLPDAVRTPLAWAGLACILVAGLRFTPATPFPGYAALLPVLGTAAVIAAHARGAASPAPLWRLPGVQWAGGASYSIYLWHWPMIVLLPYASGGHLGRLDKAAILVVTFGLSAATKTYVEDAFRFPAHRPTLGRTFRLAAAGMAVVLATGWAQTLEVARNDRAARASLQRSITLAGPCFGAAAAAKSETTCPPRPDKQVVPSLSLAPSDTYPKDCITYSPFTARLSCTFGHGPTKVALMGNSHAAQFIPALKRIADARGWTVTTYIISFCNVSTVRPKLPDPTWSTNCQAYGRWAFEQTKGHTYDLIIASQRQSTFVSGTDWQGTKQRATTAYTDMLEGWAASGATVVVIKDQHVPPTTVGHIPECLARTGYDIDACSWKPVSPPTEPLPHRWMDPMYDAARALDNKHIHAISLDDLLCPNGICRPVVGGVVTLFDSSHYTATFSTTLAPFIDDRIRQTGAW